MEHKLLTCGNFYHLYNHGVGGRNLFCDPANYEYFLYLYDKHISPLADTFAWVLMPNHFHLLVKLKEEAEVAVALNLSCLKPPQQYFSNLFNAYTKAINKSYGVNGALFERPFKRILINKEAYLKQVILYIHNNPVPHGFCSHPVEYPWSSYLFCISMKPTKLRREAVMGWFDNEANFKYRHNEKINIEKIEQWLEI